MPLALGASCRLVLRRVFKLFEVVLVRPGPDVHLGLELFFTLRAVLPASAVAFSMMVSAERVLPVIPVATVARV